MNLDRGATIRLDRLRARSLPARREECFLITLIILLANASQPLINRYMVNTFCYKDNCHLHVTSPRPGLELERACRQPALQAELLLSRLL